MISKESLLKKAARDVRQNPEYFAAFIHYYTEEKGKKPNCSGCVFKSTFSNWKQQANRKKLNPIPMATKNTFKIDKNKFKNGLYVPNNGEVVTDTSPDELAVEFLMQNDGKLFEQRKTAFTVLPESLREKPKVEKKPEPKPVVKKEAPKAKSKKKPKTVKK